MEQEHVLRKLFEIIGFIFRWFWKLLTAGSSLLANLLFLGFILLMASLFIQPAVRVPDGAALIIAPQGEIVEETTVISPFSRLINGFAGIPMPEETLLQDILDTIKAAAGDDRIKILVLSLDKMGHCGLNQLQAIGRGIERFKESGKKVIAIDDQYNQGQYYLASFADEILLNPMGSVYLRGFGAFRLYVKELIDKLAVNFHVFKVGAYKSAVEPLIRSNMSDEDREASQVWLDNLWSVFCGDIAANRGFDSQFINIFINNLPLYMRRAEGSSSRMALEANLVDDLKTRPEIDDYLISLVGRASGKQKTFKQIHFADYLQTIRPSYTEATDGRDRIGLIVARGNIVYGEDIPGQIGSDSLCRRIRLAREDDRVKALVLRIDSGGGSAFASEQIRQELLLLQQSGKPLVVSMGAMAASGAYWISAGADQIYASPFTLTGSIGIFGVFPTFDQTIAKIGITSDGTGTTKLAGAENLTLPMAPELEEIIQLGVEEGYGRFITIVAEGRRMPLEKVKKLAEGRVWDGAKARELGLIDELGGLDDAVAAAGKLAGIKDFTTVHIRESDPSGRKLLRKLGHRSIGELERFELMRPLMPAWMRGLQQQIDVFLYAGDPADIYAHCLIPRSAVAF
jgi:protease IV